MRQLVSIIMNCYNGERYLEEALNSVTSQTYKDWELIFYDNHSNDNSYKIFKSFNDKRFKYHKSRKFEKLGMARRNALSKAKGKFITFFDCDDIWLKNKISVQIKFFTRKKVGFTISNTIFFDELKEKTYFDENKKFPNEIFYSLVENYFISFDTIMIKSLFLKKLNHHLDKRFNIIHDMDLIIRLSSICEMRYAPKVLSKWRMRSDSLSYNNFGNIIKEKKVFINKINKSFKNDLKFAKSRSIFMDALCRQEILYFLTKKKYLKILKSIKKLDLNIKNLILIVIIFLPFKKHIFKYFFNIKF